MSEMETVRLYKELLEWCDKVGWDVETHDLHGRFVLKPRGEVKARLRSNSLHECVGFVSGYLAGRLLCEA